jgi:La-related protein 7
MAEPVRDDSKTSENQPSVDTEPMEIHGEISSVETPVDDGLKSSENLNASAEASVSSSAALEKSSLSYSSSSALLEKNSSSSKLNAQAPVFVPRAQVAVHVGGLIPSSFTEHSLPEQFIEQEVVGSEPESAATPTPTPSSKAVLTEELRQKVVKQVEFYFSDANLPTDKYLMKFVKKDPEGFVPIPFLANFRKVKNLVSNHSLVAAALRTSSQLVVSEDGKKVRRLHPLADTDIEEVQSRTVVAENLPNDYSIQNLEKRFGAVGNVKLVRVFQPQRYDSGQVSMKAHRNDMFVSSKLHALVEYETVEQAEKAVADLNDGGNWRSGLQVQLLLKRMGKYGHQTKGRQSDNADVHGEEEDANNTSDTGNDKQSKVTTQHSDRHDEFEGDAHYANEKNGGRKGRGRGRGKPRGRGQYHGNGRGHPLNTASTSSSSSGEVVVKQPPGPRMPDGTRGFTMGRGRPLADSNV